MSVTVFFLVLLYDHLNPYRTRPNPKDNNIHKHNGIHVDQVKNKIAREGSARKLTQITTRNTAKYIPITKTRDQPGPKKHCSASNNNPLYPRSLLALVRWSRVRPLRRIRPPPPRLFCHCRGSGSGSGSARRGRPGKPRLLSAQPPEAEAAVMPTGAEGCLRRAQTMRPFHQPAL